jgi:iron complex transport system substrate-binding protein
MLIARRTLVPLAFLLLAGAALAQDTRNVDTMMGTVAVPTAPQRIVVINSVLAGYLFALDLPVAAVDESYVRPTEEQYSEYWVDKARAQGTEVIGTIIDGVNAEQLLTLEPDVIVGGGAGRLGYNAQQAYDELSAIAPTLLVNAELGWEAELEFLATAFGKSAEAEALIAGFEARAAEVAAAITLPPQPTVFAGGISDEPGYEPWVIPETGATPRLFEKVGFELDPIAERFDLEESGSADWANLSMEMAGDVLGAPTLIVVNDYAYEESDRSLIPYMEGQEILGRLPAVETGNAFILPTYAYRFDYYGALAALDWIETTFTAP